MFGGLGAVDSVQKAAVGRRFVEGNAASYVRAKHLRYHGNPITGGSKTMNQWAPAELARTTLGVLFLCALIAEAFDVHMPKGYIYSAMVFSLAVEFLNIRARSKRLQKAAS
jgi:hypothetical protein